MGLGEGTLILSDIRRPWPFLGVQILNFWGEGVSERVISKFKFSYRIGMFFGGCKLQLFWGMSDTSDTFFGVGECLVQVYVARKKESTPPPLPGGIRRLHHLFLSFKADSHTTVHGFVFLL